MITAGNKVHPYNRIFKQRSRILRRAMTDAEQLLWLRFDNLQVLRETESVLDTISGAIAKAGER